MGNSTLTYALLTEDPCRLSVMLSVAQRLCCLDCIISVTLRSAHFHRLISNFPCFMYIPNFNTWFCGWGWFYWQLLSRQPHAINVSDDNTGVIIVSPRNAVTILLSRRLFFTTIWHLLSFCLCGLLSWLSLSSVIWLSSQSHTFVLFSKPLTDIIINLMSALLSFTAYQRIFTK